MAIDNKSEIIVDALKRQKNGESIRSIARLWGVSRPTLTEWLTDERGTMNRRLREHRIQHVNALFREGLTGPQIADKIGMSVAAVEKYKTPETKAFVKSQQAALQNWVLEQLARGLSRRQIADASNDRLTYTNVCRIARECGQLAA